MQVMGAQDHGQAERQKKAIDFALASVGPEGFALPPEVEAINRGSFQKTENKAR